MTDYELMSKIEEFRQQRGWSINHMAKECDIPQTTLDSMFKKANLPSMHTLLKICNGFGITLSQFFSSRDDRIMELTDNQYYLLEQYRLLSDSNKRLLTTMIKAMKAMQNEVEK